MAELMEKDDGCECLIRCISISVLPELFRYRGEFLLRFYMILHVRIRNQFYRNLK